MSPAVEDVYRLAWRHVRRLPAPVGYGLFHLGADTAWLAHRLRPTPTGAGQLRRNLERLLPEADGRALSRATRQALRSYARYFYEAFALPGTSREQRRARVRADLDPRVHEDLGHGSIVVALPHAGNWDLVAAWASEELAQVLTVAEHLEPEDLFEQFVTFREQMGLKVIGQRHGEKVFDHLVDAASSGHHVVALLADRDLSSAGVQSDLAGHVMRAAAGPAALADRLGLPLYTGVIRYERLHGQRRRAAGSPWGLVLTLRHVEAPLGVEGRARVTAWTRAWVSVMEPHLRAHATDWHMLQPVFDEDLDLDRLARSHARELAQETPTTGEEAP